MGSRWIQGKEYLLGDVVEFETMISDPGTPPYGKLLFYSKLEEGIENLYIKDHLGNVTNLGVVTPATKKRTITFAFDGNYAPPLAGTITTPAKVAFSGEIIGWVITNADSLAKVASSMVLTVYKNGVEISGTDKPTLNNEKTATGLSITSWTTSFDEGDEFVAYVTSASTGIKYACYLLAEASS